MANTIGCSPADSASLTDVGLPAFDDVGLHRLPRRPGAWATIGPMGVRLMYCHRNSAGAGSRNGRLLDRWRSRAAGQRRAGWQPARRGRASRTRRERTRPAGLARRCARRGARSRDLEGRLDRARCADHRPASGDERAAHLGDGRLPVGDEHEAHLAEHGVVGAVGEWQGGGVPDVPEPSPPRPRCAPLRRACPTTATRPPQCAARRGRPPRRLRLASTVPRA